MENLHETDTTYVERNISFLEPYRSISREEFLAGVTIRPEFHDKNPLPPYQHRMLIGEPRRPFMDGKYEAQMLRKGTLVWNKGELIACLIYKNVTAGTFMSVLPDYRREGLAFQMMFERAYRGWFSHRLAGLTMTEIAVGACGKVYDMIHEELAR